MLADGTTKGTAGDFIDDILPGEAAVLDNNRRDDCTAWGDIMSIYASQHGIAGTVIDGVCRDINAIREHSRHPGEPQRSGLRGQHGGYCRAVRARAGMPLKEARRLTGYHTLQTPEE